MEDAEKKKGFEKRITIEMFMEMKKRFSELPREMTHDARSKALAPHFPQFTLRTMETYSRICQQVCQEVLDLVVQGKISLTAVDEFTGGWDEKTQKYIAKEYVEQKLTRSMLRTIKRLKREHASMGYAEAISRAKGEIPPDQPRKEQKRTLDQVLTQIADHGVRWRALVEMALEMVRDEDNANGLLHQAIFEKVFILRQLVGEQYDAINNRVQRYMNLIRKKAKENGAPQAAPEDPAKDEKIIDAEFKERPDEDPETGPSPVTAQ